MLLGTENVEAEWKKQKREWAKAAPERMQVEAEKARTAQERREAERRILEAQRQSKEAERLAAAEAKRKQEEANRRWAEQHLAPVSGIALVVSNRPVCAWKDCGDPSREGSIYCSRACSNRNARWRHKQRKLASA
jgi:hypothetical protein